MGVGGAKRKQVNSQKSMYTEMGERNARKRGVDERDTQDANNIELVGFFWHLGLPNLTIPFGQVRLVSPIFYE